ncbi:MAG: hypothetical protein WAL94_01495 [Bacteroidales bacterium]
MTAARLLSCCFFYLLLPLSALSQTGNEASLSSSDSTKIPGESHGPSLYTGLGYGSNMVYLGSTISRNQPFGYAYLAFGLTDDLFLSASAFHLSYFEPYGAFYSGALTYSHDFNSWFDISAGTYRYQVQPSLADTLFSNFTYGDVAVGIDWRLLYTQISFGGFIMKDPQTYLQVKNSRYFVTPDFLKKKANISFDPYVNLLFGNMITVETFSGTTLITTTQTYTSPASSVSGPNSGTDAGSGTGLGTDAGTGAGAGTGSGSGSGSGAGTGSGTGSGSSSTTGNTSATTSTTTTTTTTTTPVPTTSTVYSENFRLIEIEFGLPVALNLNFMTLEAEASYLLPAYSDSAYTGPKGFIFTVSALFKIF